MASTESRTPDDTPPLFDPRLYPRRVNLGCGFDQRDGYVNVDFQSFHEPDLVADVRDLSMLPDGCYEEILAQDVLEHLPRTEVLPTLQTWSRKLMPGGRLVLRVPDVLGLARLLSRQLALEDQETLLQNLFGTQAYTGDFHMFGFTEVVLRHYLARSRLEVVEIVHKDEWMFDVTAVRVSGEARLDLTHLPFMSLEIPTGAAPPEPVAPSLSPAAREAALKALASARAVTDPGAVDLSRTRFRLAKRIVLRLLRLVSSRQAQHNRAVEEAIAALLPDQ
jgi:predicted SAM-dependent methyltransferase